MSGNTAEFRLRQFTNVKKDIQRKNSSFLVIHYSGGLTSGTTSIGGSVRVIMMSLSSTKSLKNQPDITAVPSETRRHMGALEEIILAQTYCSPTQWSIA